MSGLPPFPRPDPMPLREALRGLRHALRKGGETMRETLPVDVLPPPVAGLAQAVLRAGEGLARSVDQATTDMARRLIGAPEAALSPRLDAEDADPATLAAAGYAALQEVLGRLNAGEVFVSEAALRAAFQSHPGGEASPAAAAGLLTALIEARVLRDASPAPGARIAPSDLPAIALFALVLWMIAPRSAAEAEGEAALAASADLAAVIAPDILAAVAEGPARTAALFAEFADHV